MDAQKQKIMLVIVSEGLQLFSKHYYRIVTNKALQDKLLTCDAFHKICGEFKEEYITTAENIIKDSQDDADFIDFRLKFFEVNKWDFNMFQKYNTLPLWKFVIETVGDTLNTKNNLKHIKDEFSSEEEFYEYFGRAVEFYRKYNLEWYSNQLIWFLKNLSIRIHFNPHKYSQNTHKSANRDKVEKYFKYGYHIFLGEAGNIDKSSKLLKNYVIDNYKDNILKIIQYNYEMFIDSVFQKHIIKKKNFFKFETPEEFFTRLKNFALKNKEVQNQIGNHISVSISEMIAYEEKFDLTLNIYCQMCREIWGGSFHEKTAEHIASLFKNILKEHKGNEDFVVMTLTTFVLTNKQTITNIFDKHNLKLQDFLKFITKKNDN